MTAIERGSGKRYRNDSMRSGSIRQTLGAAGT